MLYKFLKIVLSVLVRIIYRWDVTGREHIPAEGAYLLCSNHIHAFDPVMIAVFSRRQPRFMAKKEIFEKKFLGWLVTTLGAFPIDRGTADMKAFRHSLDLLKHGHGMLIFAQGTRMEGFEDAKRGVAVFALKSGAPIIPIALRGSYKLFSKMIIHIGEPILMDEYAGQKVKTELVEEVMMKVVDKITNLQLQNL